MSSASSVGTSPASASPIQFTGLASGIDTSQIIQGLLAIQQAKVTTLQSNLSQVTQEQTAFQTISADVLALQNQASALSSTFNSVFDAKTVTSSNSATATGAASSTAAAGNYTFTVNSLATAQQIASQGFASTGSAITQGTFQVQVGSGASTTITIDSTNDTLQGLANAINSSGAGVTANIVNTGGAGQPYELLLTANASGAANTIIITNHLAATSGSAVQPVFNTIVQAAADASLTVGSGSGALNVTSPSNTVDNLFNGLTINLVASDASQPVTLTVANDTSSATTAVNGFVTAYNALIDYINSQSTYDSSTNTGGLLLGNTDASNILNEAANAVNGVVAGVNPLANSLAAIGITASANGDLQVNSTTLNSALSGQVPGVSPDDIRRLFALDGESSNPGVQFISAGSQTKTSSTPYQVQVTQAATQASIAGASALANSIVINSSNDSLTLAVDGQPSSTLTLSQGTYTPQTLAEEVQGQINGNVPPSQDKVAVTVDGSNQLVITSQSYGSASQVSLAAGTALSALGFAGATSSQGQNVAGSFLVNGVVEPASGSGQQLTGVSANANTAGLEVLVTLSPSQVSAEAAASLTVTRGIAAQLGTVLNTFSDPVNGTLQNLNQSFTNDETNIQQEITAQNASIQAQQQVLEQEFANMETTIASLKTTSQFLTEQFASILNPSGSTSSSSSTPSFSTSSGTSSTSSTGTTLG